MEHTIEVVNKLEAQCPCGGWTYTQVDVSLSDEEAEELMQKRETNGAIIIYAWQKKARNRI